MPRQKLKKILPVVLLCLLYLGIRQLQHQHSPASHPLPAVSDNRQVLQAFQQRQSNVPVHGTGIIVKILPDDLQGSRHQRFLVKINERQTLLIAHNIDLAPRVARLAPGEKISFAGEYEWNRRGGIVHWTHHDPRRRHPGGWLQYQGHRYQ